MPSVLPDLKNSSNVVGCGNPHSFDHGACMRSKFFVNLAGTFWEDIPEDTGSSCGRSGDTKRKAHRVLPAVCIWRWTHHCQGNLGRHCELHILLCCSWLQSHCCIDCPLKDAHLLHCL